MNKGYLEIGQKFDWRDRNNNEKSVGDNIDLGFSRDLSRIVFSNSYRRMAGKTQIFSPTYNDHLISRLTHTIMVNNIAMDISQRINKKYNNNINLELIQAIANGHDVGHTPFGHAGERILNQLLSDERFLAEKYYFKHNIFSVNILQNLDRVKNYTYGYDLAWQVIDGILKHTNIIFKEEFVSSFEYIVNNKFFSSSTLLNSIRKIDHSINSYFVYPYPITIEGQIVKVSDELAQYYHDILDLARYYKSKNMLISLLKQIFEVDSKDEVSYVRKFVETFTEKNSNEDDSKGTMLNLKIIKFENREFFCNEIKEMFIADIVELIGESINDNTIKIPLGNEPKRFIIKNLLFKRKRNKVKIKFKSKYVEKMARILEKYRDKKIKTESISQYDEYGVKVICEGVNSFLSDYKMFYKFCANDLIESLKRIMMFEKIQLMIDNCVIDSNNVDIYRNKICEFLYKKCVIDNDTEYDEKLRNIVYAAIFISIAKMTDNFLSKRKYLNSPVTNDEFII